MPDAVFTPAGDGRFRATDLARGPWDPGAQHGGAPAALLMRAFEGLGGRSGGSGGGSPGLVLARVTYELLRPVPLGELSVEASVVRPGRRAQLLEGSLWTAEGVEVVRARALRVAAAGEAAAVLPALAGGASRPGDGEPNDYPAVGGRTFATDAMDISFIAGSFLSLGPASAWFRLRHPLVDGEEPTPLQRVAAAADFGNGISAALAWDRWVFINPDLTLYLERLPVGEWFLLESETTVAPGGVGVCESVISDERGRVGRAVQALLVAPRG